MSQWVGMTLRAETGIRVQMGLLSSLCVVVDLCVQIISSCELCFSLSVLLRESIANILEVAAGPFIWPSSALLRFMRFMRFMRSSVCLAREYEQCLQYCV